MFGWVGWTEEKRVPAVQVGEREVLRMRFCTVTIRRSGRTPAALLRRRCRRAARLLRRMGITRAVFPEGFPFLSGFAQEDVRPVEALPLYRALAAELVQAALSARGQRGKETTVAVCADQLTDEVRRAVTELCIRNRYVLLDAPDREGAFCRQLRREYGVPLSRAETAEQLDRADAVVLFSARAGVFADQTVLELYAGGRLPEVLLEADGEEELPVDGCRRQLLSALWAGGALRPGQVRVRAWGKADKKEGKADK